MTKAPEDMAKPSGDIFAKAASCQWGEVSVWLDRTIPCITLNFKIDDTRYQEFLLTEGQALDLALSLAGACMRLKEERQSSEQEEG